MSTNDKKPETLAELLARYCRVKPTPRGYVSEERQHYPQHHKPPKKGM